MMKRKIKLIPFKAILFGAAFSIIVIIPLLCNLLSKEVDYKETTKSVKLSPDENHVGQVIIILSSTDKVIKVQRIKRQTTSQFSGFRNLQAFLFAGTPFFSIVIFCLFLLWYNGQPPTPYMRWLKRCAWGSLTFVSLWLIY